MDTENIFNNSLEDLRAIKEGLKKQVQLEYIKENEEKLNSALNKLLEDEISGTDSNDEESKKTDLDTTTDSVEPISSEVDITSDNKGDGSVESNIDFIDNILKDINVDDILKKSDIEATTIDIDTENKPASINIGADGEVDIKSDEPSQEIEYSEETDDKNNSSEEQELDEFYNNTKNNNNTNNNSNNMTTDENTSMDDDKIKKMMEDIERELSDDDLDNLGEPKPPVSSTKPASNTSDECGLDEEAKLMKELEDMSEDELDKMINELETSTDAPSTSTNVTYNEDDVIDEGMSAVSQTKKSVGTSTASTHQGRPERRSNMNENKDFIALKESVEKLLKVNKELKKDNTELKNINETQIKRLDTIKKKLYEATVMSHKTANVNQLFLENSLNQKEKATILESFMNVETLDESRETLKTLSQKFSDKKVLKESVEEKITKTTIQSGAGILNETKLHLSSTPQIDKMKEYINYKPKS